MGAPSSLSPKRSRFLSLSSKYRAGVYFVGGILAGVTICLVVFRLNGLALVSQEDLNHQVQLIADLQEENHELTDDLFNYREPDAVFDPTDLPYDESADARALVSDARQQASRAGKFLMITFGANWCMDCRTLYHHLKSGEVAAYTDGVLHFANVDVGKFSRNRELAKGLGVDLSRGIPVAIFYDPAGNKIGTTNDGQLEPARFYTSKQILKFVQNIVEKSQIVAPDSVQ
jgi:thioredoxin-related protein